MSRLTSPGDSRRGSSVAPQDGAFEILDDLPGPQDTVLLEASAGTGKTWTIGALVDPVRRRRHDPLESLLVITFGRAASQEMRERVREHSPHGPPRPRRPRRADPRPGRHHAALRHARGGGAARTAAA
jgi:superfamily I DNA/RNA helicase